MNVYVHLDLAGDYFITTESDHLTACSDRGCDHSTVVGESLPKCSNRHVCEPLCPALTADLLPEVIDVAVDEDFDETLESGNAIWAFLNKASS